MVAVEWQLAACDPCVTDSEPTAEATGDRGARKHDMDATLEAVKAADKGKNEARRLRAAGRIPAVVYGGPAARPIGSR